MDEYFNFITFLAFKTALIYGNKRSLSIQELHDFRIYIYEQIKKYYETMDSFVGSGNEKNVRDYLSFNQDMTAEDEIFFLNLLIKRFDNFFISSDDVVKLKDNITYDMLDDFCMSFLPENNKAIIYGAFINYSTFIGALKTINSERMVKIIDNMIAVENVIQDAYQNHPLKVTLIQKLTKINEAKLALISNMDVTKINCYQSILEEKLGDGDNISFDLLSSNIKSRDTFYYNNLDYINDINNACQKAIFTNEPLAIHKLFNILSMIACYANSSEDLDSSEEVTLENYFDEDDLDEDYLDDLASEYDENIYSVNNYLYYRMIDIHFFIRYIENIKDYLNQCGDGEELENVIGRLKYILDAYGANLYLEDNYQALLKRLDEDEGLSQVDFISEYILARLFLTDILKYQNIDNLTMRKILFVGTYYELTYDENIKNLISEYQETRLGQMLEKAIIHHDYNLIKNKRTRKKKEDTVLRSEK